MCDYFGVSMDSMARDDVEFPEEYTPNSKGIHMTSEEQFLITCYREADSLDKELALRALHVREKGTPKNGINSHSRKIQGNIISPDFWN